MVKPEPTAATRRSRELIALLKAHANPENVAGMARYGISSRDTLGISIPFLRDLAREHGRDHELAAGLWDSGIHEASILACFVDEPARVTPEQMDSWAADFDSWDVCDQCCSNLFDRTPHAYGKAEEWSGSEAEFVKRAAFALMAALAVHDKKADDAKFEAFLPLIERGAGDERNFVKKAVNWALRQIGKRNLGLNCQAVALAGKLAESESKVARWVGRDALKELTSEKVLERLERSESKIVNP